MVDISGVGYWAGSNFASLILWWLIPAVILLIVLFCLMAFFDPWDTGAEAVAVIVFTLFLLWLFMIGLINMVMVPHSNRANIIEEMKIEQISKTGYSHVELNMDGDKFTASKEGKYVQGALVEIETNKYKIVEL